MKPPYKINSKILSLISSISEKLGEIKSAHLIKPPAELRKRNRIKTIHSSLEIEGNTLTIEQITDIINNKRVLAPKKDILEAQNAIELYSKMALFKVYDFKSLCQAHKILMKGLVERPGKLRSTTVGIVKENQVAHLAPPGSMVNPLMNDLFNYLKNSDDILLIKSCVFHYEFEFIHPFTDGNGRMGRFWQTMILRELSPVFEFLPVELIVKERQEDYYRVLGESDNQGESTPFIEFMLNVIDGSLEELLSIQNLSPDKSDRVELFKLIVKKDYFTRQDYLRHNKDISPATASRDLKDAVKKGVLKKTGDKRLTKYQYAR